MKVNKINILGTGPGDKKYILPIVFDIVKESDLVIGGRRNLTNFDLNNKEVLEIISEIDKIVEFIKRSRDKKIAILASGDPLFYGIGVTISRYFPQDELNIVPGISSVQYLFCKLDKSWNDYHLATLHGNTLDIIETIEKYKKVVFLTDKNNDYKMIAGMLSENKYSECFMTVAINLSYEDEKIVSGIPADFINIQLDDRLAIVVVEYE